MPNKPIKCIMSDKEFCQHGCFYFLNDGTRACKSPCTKKLIEEVDSLKKENEELKEKIHGMLAEVP